MRHGAFFIIFAKEICMIRTVERGVFEKRFQGSSHIEFPGIMLLFVLGLNQIDRGQIRIYCLLDRCAAFTG